jgi:sarcosine oxidase/L-pipecolate oxidase
MATAAQANGVQYISGDAGYVQSLIYDKSGKCTGAVTKTSQVYFADMVILCTGASTAALVEAKDENHEIIALYRCDSIDAC